MAQGQPSQDSESRQMQADQDPEETQSSGGGAPPPLAGQQRTHPPDGIAGTIMHGMPGSGSRSGPRPLQEPGYDVHAHAQGGLADFGRILVHLGILPSVSQIAFMAIEYHGPALFGDPVRGGALAVVLVHLGQPARKSVMRAVHRMPGRKRGKRMVRKQGFHFAPEG